MDKRFFNVSAEALVFKFLPNNTLYELLTKSICRLTELTTDEVGILGHNMYFDTRDQTIKILTKFDTRSVQLIGTGFGGGGFTMKPFMNKLHGRFFYGKVETYIFDLDEKENEVTIEWHSDILLAWLAGVSLLDKSFRLTTKPIEKQKTEKKKTAVISEISVYVSINKNGEYREFDINEVEEFIDSLA